MLTLTPYPFNNPGSACSYEMRDISLEEVAKHNTDGDCWVVIDGIVYDLSKFLKEHPVS